MFKLKKPLILGGVLFVAGAAMMVTTVGQSNFDFSWDRGVKLVDVKKTEQKFDNIKTINVNANSGVVRIVEGSEGSVTSWSVDNQKASATQKGDVLSVEAVKNEGLVRGAFLSTPEAFEYSAKITVPAGTKLENLNLTMDDGGVIVQGLNVKHTKVTSGRGGANLSEFTGESLTMTTKDGRLSFDDVKLDKLKVTGRDAYVYGSFVTLAEASNIELRDGNVSLSSVTAPGLQLETGKFEEAFVYVTKSSEEDAYLDENNPFYDYKNELDIDNKKEQEKARKKQEKARAQNKYKKGKQEDALKINLRDGEIKLYDMK
ncbi:DUF4097 domain-containing protein [Weissella ceti]|uniref:DUF4097 domain-containing protein n=1 Tax=Weissella ceti TaxID=759620 RepID=A0ABT3E611_9LACO|nr:DUF4097 family beta strand repeat-containing protein [Weissella ceti]MCW0953850.1 DUF4097 domain-containing protein [Weissella ceti]QVK11653.1 DUF4097 family beta strand repeat protein [Weissella ceti]